MYVIDRIAGYTGDAADWFYEVYLDVNSWVWPFWKAADWFYDLCYTFNRIKWRFEDFSEDMDDILDDLGDILSWSNIRSLMRSWLPDIEDLVDWWDRWWVWIGQEIDDWWDDIKWDVRSWIADVKSWAITEINNAVENITQVVTNIWDYSQTIINNTTEYITQVWNNFYDYSVTTINNITETITQVWNNFYDYSVTTINNITETITQLIDWSKVTLFLNDWWNNITLDLEDLIDSTLKLWFPFYDDLVELWNSIAEFFCDPLDWLKDRIEVWFWGGEE